MHIIPWTYIVQRPLVVGLFSTGLFFEERYTHIHEVKMNLRYDRSKNKVKMVW